LWCKNCNRESNQENCELCGAATEQDTPVYVYWCKECNTPIIKSADRIDINICSLCGSETTYMSADLRPVFPEERLLLEVFLGKPLEFIDKTVWAYNNRFYIDGKPKSIPVSSYKKRSADEIAKELDKYKEANRLRYGNHCMLCCL
jgi:phosphoadenosine phosphosulfate reductase